MSDIIQTPLLQLGSISLDFVGLQAALSGYSDWPMRVIAKRQGAAYTLCEVMLDQFVMDVKEHRQKNRHFFKLTDEEHPVGGQLMGADPKAFGPAAVRLVDAGFDVIDINFGCPVKKVLGRCRGGYLLSQPDIALEIIANVRDAVPEHVPVTVKMRRGIDESDESRDHFFRILEGAWQRGVSAVTVHGRTVEQKYKGASNQSFLREVKQHSGKHIVIGSGDLFSAYDCIKMLTETKVDAVSIARGAIGNPWIFAHLRALLAGKEMSPPTVFEQREVITEHYRLAEETYEPKKCCSTMRKFGIQYAPLHPQKEEVRVAFTKVKSPAEWQEVIQKWYREDLPGRWNTRAK